MPAHLLSLIEEQVLGGGAISDHVDMICGTSTGGIIAIGLGLRISAREIDSLYMDRGAIIFPKTARVGILKAKHARAALDSELKSVFQDRRFGDCAPRMVIPSFDHHLEPSIFKTDHHPDYKRDWKNEAWEVAAATSAAPVYLSAHVSKDRIQWDGGMFANHPLMNGIVDALSCYDLKRENIRVLSIGCGKETHRVKASPRTMAVAGFKDWALELISTASALQLHDSLGQAGLLIGRQNLLRLDPPLPIKIGLDAVPSARKYLPSIAQSVFELNYDAIKSFFNGAVRARERHYSNLSDA